MGGVGHGGVNYRYGGGGAWGGDISTDIYPPLIYEKLMKKRDFARIDHQKSGF